MARAITPFLMFEGAAEEAMKPYVSLFRDSRIQNLERYAPGESRAEGTIKRAELILGGQHFLCIDSPVKHDFRFTPSVSVFVDCESEGELLHAFSELSSAAGC
jgi:predicted 3-demethylubiquinone-9 3-methyltransferase (glyoxalase superfamily)